MGSRMCVGLILAAGLAAGAAETPPAWEKAYLKGPMSADETRAFMKKLARFVVDNHMRKDPNSPVRGMIYEYLDTTRKGQPDQFVQGEALDTMHDGSWFAAAMVNAYRATGDPFYKEILAKWQLPFYLKMLNHSDELFSASSLPKAIHGNLREGMPRDRPTQESAEYPPEGVKPSGGGAAPRRDDSRPNSHKWGKEWLLQAGEKGFVPYWWDDGGSVSLERRQDKNPLGVYQCVDHLAGKPNPKFLLDGYALGSSNHMAQDLGVMLELAWLLFRESPDEADKKLTAEIAEAAKNLYECRMRHHGPIPMCVAPWALASGDPKLMKQVPDPNDKGLWTPKNHYTRALYDFEPGKPCPLPGFADDQEYLYYHGIARAGGKLPKPLAFKLIYDAYTHPMLFRYYCDDWEVPPGINVFDLYPYQMKDGRPTDYRSEKKGPRNTVKPIGSRFGPQNMVVCGWALQAMKTYPGIWEEPYQRLREQGKLLPLTIVDTSLVGKFYSLDVAVADFGDLLVGLEGDLKGLALSFLCKPGGGVMEIFREPDGKGKCATITIKKDKTVSVSDAEGQALKFRAEFTPWKEGFGLTLYVPWTASHGQKPWTNGIQHGRGSIRVGEQVRNCYVLTGGMLVEDWLKTELGGGLRTWEAIFNEKGYIPTGMGTAYDWDKFSDTGGYAHLISAAAQWLLYLEGKRDWEIHKIPAILKASP